MPRTVAELAEEAKLARSTAFDLVGRMQEAQLVAREATGKLTLGPIATALSFGRFGLAPLHGPAQALIRWLRDHCDATVTLTCVDGGERVALASLSAAWWKAAHALRSPTLTYAIDGEVGCEVARLELVCRPDCSRSQRVEIEQLALRAKATLEHHLQIEATRDIVAELDATGSIAVPGP